MASGAECHRRRHPVAAIVAAIDAAVDAVADCRLKTCDRRLHWTTNDGDERRRGLKQPSCEGARARVSERAARTRRRRLRERPNRGDGDDRGAYVRESAASSARALAARPPICARA